MNLSSSYIIYQVGIAKIQSVWKIGSMSQPLSLSLIACSRFQRDLDPRGR
jgi:hypothetical protein